MKEETNLLNRKRLDVISILLLIIGWTVGLSLKDINAPIAATVLYVSYKLDNINLLYSALFTLFLFINSIYLEKTGLMVGPLQYLFILFLSLNVMVRPGFVTKVKKVTQDKLMRLMVVIFILGLMSSFFSIKPISSIKNTISTLAVFITFYIYPKYFLDEEEKGKIFNYIFFPVYSLLLILSTINLGIYFGYLQAKENFLWITREAIYTNSNFFGLMLLSIITLMNLYIFVRRNPIRENVEKQQSITFKTICLYILFLISYIIFFFNLVLSGSRTSLGAALLLTAPVLFKGWKISLAGVLPLTFLIHRNKDRLLLLQKIGKGTSGRTELWMHVMKNVIPKHPILGVGSGAFREYMVDFSNKSVHNAYLHILMTNGIPTFILWLVILYSMVKKIFSLKLNRSIYIFTLLSYLIYAVFEIGLFGGLTIRMSIFWLMFMLIDRQLYLEGIRR